MIEGAFGKSGKTRLAFPSGLSQPPPDGRRSAADNVVTLRCKRFVFDKVARGVMQ